MNKSIRFRIYVASALLCLTLFASCSADDGTELPEGKYPMTFATAMEGLTQTRATTDNTWKGDEKIAVQVGSEVKQYKPESGQTGKLTGADADNTFYWQKTDETKKVSAWYCGTGYEATQPTTWTVQTNQSGDGYAKSDFLYALPQDIAYSDRDKGQLTFKHLPAKVVINLTKGNGLTEENIQSATVSIVSQTITSGVIDGTTGIMEQNTVSGSETIITNVLATPEAGFQKSVQAIVVPQQLTTGTQFIKVTIGEGTDAARDYYYTTKSDTEVNLECGKQYTYNITVKKTGLAVEVSSKDQWTNSNISGDPSVGEATFRITLSNGSLPVSTTLSGIRLVTAGATNVYETTAGGNSFSFSYTTANRLEVPGLSIEKGMATGKWTETTNAGGTTTYTYTCANIRSDLWLRLISVGDYYYADGTWSNEYNTSGPACIGIVCSTDVSRIGQAAKDALTNKSVTPHGLVMALTNASEGCRWGGYGIDENSGGAVGAPFKDNTTTLQQQYNNVDGYGETHWMLNNNGSTLQNVYTAFFHASRYGTADGGTSQYAAPANTTDWFIPSMGQWWDILSNLGGIDLTAYRDDSSHSDQPIPGAAITAANNINRYLGKIKGATMIAASGNFFWSSSEYDKNSACDVLFYGYSLYLRNISKNSNWKVRCVLAF